MIKRHGARERTPGPYGRDISGTVCNAHTRNGRGGIDDHTPALFFHHRNGVFAPEIDAVDIHSHQGIPVVFRCVDHRAGNTIARIVDENVQTPMA